MNRNAHGRTLDRLGEAIVAGRYPPGSTVPPEPVLGGELGVSRRVVREAIKSLAPKGLGSTGPKAARGCWRPNSGMVSTPTSSRGKAGPD